MSFGFAIGDFIALTQLASNVVSGARRACGAYDELTRETTSLHIVLRRLESEVAKPKSILNSDNAERRAELAELVEHCEKVLKVLDDILKKYNGLSEEKRKVTQLWKTVQFGNGEMRDLSNIRLELSTHTNAITMFLNLSMAVSLGKVEEHMVSHSEELRAMRRSVNWVTASMQGDVGHKEGSVLTSYANDDKAFWKKLRRELVKEGYPSSVLEKHETLIRDYVKELGDRGALDELPLDGSTIRTPAASGIMSGESVMGSASVGANRRNVAFSDLKDESIADCPRLPARSHRQQGLSKAPGSIVVEIPHETSSNDPPQVNIDVIIDKLLAVRGQRPGTQVHLHTEEIRYLCKAAREIFLSQPVLLELESPVIITGSIHGQYYDLLRLFDCGGYPPKANYLFLGNCVDRGKQSTETICLLLAYKIKYPEDFFILRGKHECGTLSKIYGFYDECLRRYNSRLWAIFVDCFNCLPIAAIIGEKIFAMHGGLSPNLISMDQIRSIKRPTNIPGSGLLCDLLWADPKLDITGWSENDRGISFTFGPDIVDRFLQKHKLDLICRSGQVVPDGYEFFAKQGLVTIFGAPNYCEEWANAGATMSVDDNLLCSFGVLL